MCLTDVEIYIFNFIVYYFKNQRGSFLQGLSTGLKSLPDKVHHLIIMHIGRIVGVLNVFELRKTRDYHEDM